MARAWARKLEAEEIDARSCYITQGSSTEATIPNGEDLDPEDFEGLCIALEKRCKVTGVARVKILGYIDPN